MVLEYHMLHAQGTKLINPSPTPLQPRYKCVPEPSGVEGGGVGKGFINLDQGDPDRPPLILRKEEKTKNKRETGKKRTANMICSGIVLAACTL